MSGGPANLRERIADALGRVGILVVEDQSGHDGHVHLTVTGPDLVAYSLLFDDR